MNGRFVVSLCFMSDHDSILTIHNITKMKDLIDSHTPKAQEITTIIAPNDWFNFNNELNVFDFLSEKIEDSQHKSAILNSLSQIFPLYALDDAFNNDSAIEDILKQYDGEHYHAIVCALDIDEKFREYNLVKAPKDYQKIHEKYLCVAPHSNKNYAERCIEIFDKIKFSDDFAETLATLGNKQGIIEFAEKVTNAISTLNRIDPAVRDMETLMHWIRSESGFDCTVQGKNKRHLFPTVTLDDGSKTEINCEFHIKINTRNNGGRAVEHSRLYFGLMPLGQTKHSYIHHCGEHL